MSLESTWSLAEPELEIGRPTLLFRGDYDQFGPPTGYDVTPDGHFVMVRLEEEQQPPVFRTHLIQNFGAELERLLP